MRVCSRFLELSINFFAVFFMLICEAHKKSLKCTICCFIMFMFSWGSMSGYCGIKICHPLSIPWDGARRQGMVSPSRRNKSLKLIVSFLIIKTIIELLQGDSHQERDNNSLYLGHKEEIYLILDYSGIWFTISNVFIYLIACI